MVTKNTKYEYVKSRKEYRIRITDESGKRIPIYGKTVKELEAKLEKRASQQGMSVTGRRNPFFNDYAQHWLDLHGVALSFGTMTNYRYLFNHNIAPHMKGKRLLDIKEKDIDAVLTHVADKSQSVFEGTALLIKQVFDFAYENHDVLKHPCQKTKTGGIPPAERDALTPEQVSILLDAVKETRAYLFCMIGIYTGMRREEILGLGWDCVHLGKSPHIIVRRALRFVHNQPEVTETLKTKASKRKIPIPPQLVSCLEEEKKTAKSTWVVANSQGGPLSQSQFKNLWNAVRNRTAGVRTYKKYVNGQLVTRTITSEVGQKSAHHRHYYTIDFKVTPHILRHTYITNLLLSGMDIKSVQYLAGHKKSKITLDIYAHLIYNRPEDIIHVVNAAFASHPTGEEGTTYAEKT